MTTINNTGAFELRALYYRNISRGLMLAGIIHLTLIGSYRFYTFYSEQEMSFPKRFNPDRIIVLPPPPPLHNTEVVPHPILSAETMPSVGTPIPVPDATISPEATFATQEEMNQPVVGTETGDPDGAMYIPDNTVIEETEPEAFRPVQKMPEVIRSVFPPYPEIARRAGVEGTVYVKMWVTKEGKVKRAEIVRSTANLFNDIVLEAALQWTFTPAIMNNGPVSVWVTVPFKFHLHQK